MPATTYKVVVNHEEQYRLIPAAAKIPKGWRSPGLPPGTLEECRAQLVKVWKQAKPGEVEQAISEAEKRQP